MQILSSSLTACSGLKIGAVSTRLRCCGGDKILRMQFGSACAITSAVNLERDNKHPHWSTAHNFWFLSSVQGATLTHSSANVYCLFAREREAVSHIMSLGQAIYGCVSECATWANGTAARYFFEATRWRPRPVDITTGDNAVVNNSRCTLCSWRRTATTLHKMCCKAGRERTRRGHLLPPRQRERVLDARAALCTPPTAVEAAAKINKNTYREHNRERTEWNARVTTWIKVLLLSRCLCHRVCFNS